MLKKYEWVKKNANGMQIFVYNTIALNELSTGEFYLILVNKSVPSAVMIHLVEAYTPDTAVDCANRLEQFIMSNYGDWYNVDDSGVYWVKDRTEGQIGIAAIAGPDINQLMGKFETELPKDVLTEHKDGNIYITIGDYKYLVSQVLDTRALLNNSTYLISVSNKFRKGVVVELLNCKDNLMAAAMSKCIYDYLSKVRNMHFDVSSIIEVKETNGEEFLWYDIGGVPFEKLLSSLVEA